MDYRFLKCSCERKGVVVLTISSPATLNALNSTILEELEAFVDALDPAVTRVLVITGEGKAFVVTKCRTRHSTSRGNSASIRAGLNWLTL